MNPASAKRLRRELALPALVCAMCLAALPMATAGKDVKLAFIVKDAKVCRGQASVKLEVELRNTGKQSLALDISQVGFMYSYYPPPRPKAGERSVDLMFMDTKVFSNTPAYMVIAAGESVKRELEIRLPPRIPYDAVYLDLTLMLPKQFGDEKEYQGVKIFKSEMNSKQTRFRIYECES